jgi:energy-coupling factor transporter ATP-binding protein EcfA2
MIAQQNRSNSAYHPPSPTLAPVIRPAAEIQDTSAQAVLDYGPELFVQPAKTYRWLLSEIGTWAQVRPDPLPCPRVGRARHLGSQWIPDGRVLTLVGERGAGKTWLLRHLAHSEPQLLGRATYIDLATRSAFSEPHGFVRFLQASIRRPGQDGQAVLLLDNVPPELDNHLRAVETAILKPHLEEQGSLVVMALTDSARVCWLTPALRGKVVQLAPFSPSQTREQLSCLGKVGAVRSGIRPSQIHRASQGLPLLNYLLATHSHRQSFELLLDYWLEGMSNDESGQMRILLQAICALEVLEHAKVQAALDLYRLRRPDLGENQAHPRQVRNLVRRGLARSLPESPGRVALVPSVRRAAAGMLQDHDPELYMALQTMAAE